jgi:hypothetical protein
VATESFHVGGEEELKRLYGAQLSVVELPKP